MDAAGQFPAVLRRFQAWTGEEPFTLYSWGGYDLDQLWGDCHRHNLLLPPSFECGYVNLKQEFARAFLVKSYGMSRALEIAGLSLEGTHRRGRDDARSIARLATLVLPRLEAGRRGQAASDR